MRFFKRKPTLAEELHAMIRGMRSDIKDVADMVGVEL